MLLTDKAISSAQTEFGKFWYVYINFVTSHFLKSEIASLKKMACLLPNFITCRREFYLWSWCICIDLGHKLYFLELECLFCSVGNEWCFTILKQNIVLFCFLMKRLVVLCMDS